MTTYKTKKGLRALATAACLAAVVSACAAPKQGAGFDRASQAIRAAENAGARQHAPVPYSRANELYSAAEAMNNRRRSDRAQKLLDLATAQANLAEATSEAALAEQSLGYIHIRQPR